MSSSSPAWTSVAILLAGGVVAAASSRFESPRAQENAFDRVPFEGVSDLGNVYGATALPGLSLGLTLAGKFGAGPSVGRLGRSLSRALLYTTAATWATKLAVDRARPNGGHYSFPSGHTASAFAAAPVLMHEGGWKAGAAAYALALSSGLGRLEDRRHYLSDVVFGAAIGIAAGQLVVAEGAEPEPSTRLWITPRGFAVRVGF